jgi:undecaprenyl-diphosphatase
MVVGFGVLWLATPGRPAKVEMAAQAVLGVVLMAVFMYLAKSVHHDPRPFVQNPRIHPLFGHSRDDGFPSDHSLAAGLIATLVLVRHRLLGLLFAAAAIVIAWARVAAHVHHLQDVVAGLLLGALAALVAAGIVALVERRRVGRPASRHARADLG